MNRVNDVSDVKHEVRCNTRGYCIVRGTVGKCAMPSDSGGAMH